MRMRIIPFWRSALCTAALVLTGLGGVWPPHIDLRSSVPADRSQLATAPGQLILTFTERPEITVTRIRLYGTDSLVIPLGEVAASGSDLSTVTAPINGALAPGTYRVEWEATGEDGHPNDGMFTFTLLAGDSDGARSAKGAPDTTGKTTTQGGRVHPDSLTRPTRFNSESLGYVLVRVLLFASLLIVVGTVAFRFGVLELLQRNPNAGRSFVAGAAQRAAALGAGAAWLLLVACLARLIAQWMAMNANDSAVGVTFASLITTTRWGFAWIVQVFAIIAVVTGFHLIRRHKLPRPATGWVVAGVAALIGAFTPALAGHAAVLPSRALLAIVADGIHIIGASGWLGSLAVVLYAGIPAAMTLQGERRDFAVANLIKAFSPTALVFATVVVSTGLFAAWQQLGSLTSLWNSAYGRVLIAKLIVVSGVGLTGAYNWRRVTPALGADTGTNRMRRSAAAEVTLGLLIVLVTAVLVATPTPR